MSSVIVLSDSDEPSSPIDKCCGNGRVSETNEKYHTDTSRDIDLPEVPFCRRTESSSSPNDEDLYDFNVNNVDDPKRARRRSPHAASDSHDSEDNRVEKATAGKGSSSKKNKSALKEERLKRQQTLAREKALRAITSKKSRDMKPGECVKFMEVNLDEGINAFPFSAEIQTVLRDADVSFNVTTESIPNSITWQRNIEECFVDENNEIRARRRVQKEKYAVVIWSNREAVRHVADGTLRTSVSSCKALIPDYSMTLVIFGMEEYFACGKKASKERSEQNSGGKGSRHRGKGNQQFDALPIISRQQLEMCLTEVQIVDKCSSRLIENAQDLGLMIYQYTKSISEIPYKLQKKDNLESKFDWYVMGDNRNTVRVDKDGNGLKRLWQQQLSQFNLSTLETAEAICNVYPSPAQLVEAYRNRTPEEGMNLLRDIPIRRAAGPLTAARKVGPELSKKIYVMFTSENGDALLGAED
ncbi:PREDICTED: crossover junction endonuclease EME1 [Dinoponera quadriceps]|uniref:Crossover junction endonuclease EME1 n=1 Tax=Dinoponera quadriceps TaxID=609295 RepID=A0A6P3Y2E6_DINQU|nr:PREDICTED: crossover junction endonuclease EME1 [Dinoponera quadriceps]XP_014485020.1 PREDICTED: crossover junction endonuclease EME1 [Dinoponera quadriceps]XP_014485021.1 PREDICTED: crossover junction endonuclease EME1 [Dinoponera quadriceps]XP_014485022.1 PREDICTED: crossover junction endonuclease EME1 [Dinoponera quadriceps]